MRVVVLMGGHYGQSDRGAIHREVPHRIHENVAGVTLIPILIHELLRLR